MRYLLIWIFISLLIVSKASDESFITTEEEVCDEDCLAIKSNFQLEEEANERLMPRSNPETCSLQGIDTGISDESFKLFGLNDLEYDTANLIKPNGICDCSKNPSKKHAVVKKEVNGKIVLTDAYISCKEENSSENVLEELLYDYIKNIPDRTLGSKLELRRLDHDCLDDHGFFAPKLPGEISCFSYMYAYSNETYSSTNQLLEGNVNYYSGPFSVNRINQSEELVHPSNPGKNFSMLGLFYQLGYTCNFIGSNNRENKCYLFFNNVIYSIICCCNNNEPGQCSLRRYKEDKDETKQICATGNFSWDLESGQEGEAYAPEEKSVTAVKEQLTNKTFCSSKYIFNNKSIKYEMPAPGLNKCNAGADSEGYCILDNIVCPSDDQNPPETSITCCCKRPNLCNVDFVAIKAVARFEFMSKNKVCEQPMLYSVLFARTNYTLEDVENPDHKRPLCYLHYDVNQPTVRYFLPNNNLDLLRDVDYKAYQREGCDIIAATIRSNFYKKCTKENYTNVDAILPRPLLVCTCNGSKIDEETDENTVFCDAELRQNIGNIYNERKDELMPKCLVRCAYDTVLASSTIKMSTKSVFCYMELTMDFVDEKKNIGNFSLTAGIADLKNGYGTKCLDLYKEKQSKGESTEKSFCKFSDNNETLCCTIAMKKEPLELLDEVTEKIVEQKVLKEKELIKKHYGNQKSLRCSTSKDVREFGNKCNHPHGCFWTDSSAGEVKTTSVAGCIDAIPKLLEKNASNPIYRSIQTCSTISKLKRSNKMEIEKDEEGYQCFATNEINYPDDKDHLTNVFIVCCCTEIDENGRCKKNDKFEKRYGAKVIDVGNDKIPNQHKNQIYSVPF